jgi:hypothetical protein
MYCYERGDQAKFTCAFLCVHLFVKLPHNIWSKMQIFPKNFLISKFHRIFISWMYLIKDVIFFNFFLDFKISYNFHFLSAHTFTRMFLAFLVGKRMETFWQIKIELTKHRESGIVVSILFQCFVFIFHCETKGLLCFPIIKQIISHLHGGFKFFLMIS